MAYSVTIGGCTRSFGDLKILLAKATPARSGDALAGVSAEDEEERALAKMALLTFRWRRFLEELLIPYEQDEVTRLIVDTHDAQAFTGNRQPDRRGVFASGCSILQRIRMCWRGRRLELRRRWRGRCRS